MRGVVSPPHHGGLSLSETQDDHQRGVEERIGEDQQWDNDRGGDGGAAPAPLDRQAGKEKAQEQAPRVPHEDARPEIGGEKAETRAGERRRGRCRRELLGANLDVARRQEGERHRRNGGYPRRKPVHIIQQIERVRDPDDPQQRDRHVQPGGAKKVDTNSSGNDDAGQTALVQETEPPAQGLGVRI